MKVLKVLIMLIFMSVISFADEIIITKIPFSMVNPDSLISFSWAGVTADRLPVDAKKVLMKYSQESGKYTNIISKDYLTTFEGYDAFSFVPSEYSQGNFSSGRYFARFEYEYLGNVITSREFNFIIESKKSVKMTSPITSTTNGIEESVPVFMWEKNGGVPYYHIFLSDEPISVDEEEGTVAGISAIWQAITPKNSIQYGEPDPSGEFSDIQAPPLMPGVEYNWIVLNNYGNSIITSSQVIGLPSVFTIKASSDLKKPKNIFPIDNSRLNSKENAEITFNWTSGGKSANTYEIYLFISDSISGVEAKVNIWKGVTTDTFFVFNAAQTIYNKTFYWKVYALDEKGVGAVSDMTQFDYKIDVSWLNIRTYASKDKNNLGNVSLKAEPIEGSADIIPFASNGEGSAGTRQFLLGTYKINASKDGYLSNSVIADLTKADDTTYVKLYLQEAPSAVKGFVYNTLDKTGIGQVDIIAKSGEVEVKTQTDETGYYLLDLPKDGQWRVLAQKNGFESALPINVSVKKGDRKTLSSIYLTKSAYSIYGNITNGDGSAISRAMVAVYEKGKNEPYISMTTADNGFYSFNVPYKNWIVKVSASGFASKSKEILGLAKKNQIDFMLNVGGQISGTIYKKEYILSQNNFGSQAQLAKARVGLVNIDLKDTTYLTTDVYGKFAQGVAYGKYKLFASKDGYISNDFGGEISVTSSKRTVTGIDVTLTALASLNGSVSSLDEKLNAVNVSLKKNGEVFLSTQTKNINGANGEYRLEDIPDGSYTISVAKKGYENLPELPLVVSNGIISKRYDFTLKKGNLHSLLFYPKLLNSPHTTGEFKITSPYLEDGENFGDYCRVDSLSVGNYRYSYFTQNIKVLDIISGEIRIDDTSSSEVKFNRELYFIAEPLDTFATKTDTVKFVVSGQNVGDMFVYYKNLGEENYQEQKMTFLNGAYFAKTVMAQTGVVVDYYYKITDKSTNTTYSNIDRPYYSHLRLITKLDYVKWNPSLPDTATTKVVLVDNPLEIKIDGYNRGIIKNELIKQVSWSSTDSTIASFKSKETSKNDNIIYPLKDGIVTIFATVVGVKNEVFDLSAKIEVFDGAVDSAYLVRLDKSPDDYSIKNTEIAEFILKAKIVKKDNSKHTISLLPNLKTIPSKGIAINGGEISFNDNFVGQLEISSRINNYGTVFYNQSSTKRERNRHLHVVSLVNEGDTLSNYRNLSIYFPKNSFEKKGTDEMRITEEIITSSQKILGKHESIGEVLNLQMVNNNTFKKPVSLIYDIPQEYQERESFILSYYNDSLLEFVAVDSSKLVDDSVVTMQTEHFSIYSLMAQREALSIENVVFSPNPFSPYVSARDNDRKYYGLGIKFFSSSQEDDFPSIKIEIFTMSGVRVFTQEGGQEIESGNQEFNWDGRTSLTRKICPNGRYIVKITASEKKTGKEVVYKGIVVLVK